MNKTHCTLALLALTIGCDQPQKETTLIEGSARRTPAEWEEQEAVWLQWPQAYEGDRVQDAFVEIVAAIAPYENVVLIANSSSTQSRGEAALSGVSGSITWHIIDNDNSWMRDNGPRYVEVDGALVLQNWEFDAWGGGFGNFIPYDADNSLPDAVAELLDMPLEQVGLVHERGDLEVNGTDTAIVSWSVLSHRNPDLSRSEITAQLEAALGVTSVVYIEGFDPLDGTRGHVDGMVRFISEDTVVVGDSGSALLDSVAEQVAEQRPDLDLIRMSIDGYDSYLNWLVGDGFVVTGSGTDDAAARAQLKGYFPDRDILFVDIDALWSNGGGVHCVTNDQPAG